MALVEENPPANSTGDVRDVGGVGVGAAWVPGQEDPLEEGMATHCSFLAWRIPQTDKSLEGYSS